MNLSINIATPIREALDTNMGRAITQMAAIVARNHQRGKLPSGPGLNITFMLSSQVEKPDFTGMRMGGYTDREKVLYFEKAVPEELLQSEKAGSYVTLVLQDVIHNASEYFDQYCCLFDRVSWEQWFDQLEFPR